MAGQVHEQCMVGAGPGGSMVEHQLKEARRRARRQKRRSQEAELSGGQVAREYLCLLISRILKQLRSASRVGWMHSAR
eukprot:11155666-Lingulodinium_polyedra.AAC.1